MSRVAVLLALLSRHCSVAAGIPQGTAKTESAPILIIENVARGEVPINGKWQFHLDDDMLWAAPAYDDSQWERITADKAWGMETHPSYTGFAWYRRHLDISPSPVPNQKLAILIL